MAISKTTSKEVSVNKSTELATSNQMPAFMQKYANKGTENLDVSDIEIPRLQLLQGLSGAVQEGNGKAGEFFHTALDESLGDTVKVVVLMVRKRYVLWNPLHMGGGILARADDAVHWNPANVEFEVQPHAKLKRKVVWATKDTVSASGLDQFGTSDPEDPDSPPAATLMYDIAVCFPDREDLGMAVFTLQRTGVKAAKKLNAKLMASEIPSFGRYFVVKSSEAHSGEFDYYLPVFTSDGVVEDPEEFALYAQRYETLSRDGLNIRDEEGLQRETASNTAGEDV